MNEIWKDIKGYEGRYQVSNLGRVWSIISQKYLVGGTNHGGYHSVQLTAKNGKMKREYVHRLVALAFIPNPLGLPQVNHKDENKDNNSVDNLEWCTAKYNNNYGTCRERAKMHRSYAHYGNHPQAIPVVCVETGEEFSCAKEAGDKLHLDNSSISKCCKGKAKTCGGYHWRFAKEVS